MSALREMRDGTGKLQAHHRPVRATTCLLILSLAGCMPRATVAPIHNESSYARIEAQFLGYDRQDLGVRVLVTPTSGEVAIDSRFIEEVSVGVREVQSCGGVVIRHLIADQFPPPTTEADIIHLKRGAWYGRDLRFGLFLPMEPGPQCIDVSLIIWPETQSSAERKALGEITVRANSG